MATIRAFRALRPARDHAPETSAVPYDVVNTNEARELAAASPLSFLHVSRPEIDLPDGIDPYSDAVYSKAAENFDRLRQNCPLFFEDFAALYIYRLRAGRHEQTGITAGFSLDEYDGDVIRKHERTRKDKEDDRTRHIVALRAQTGPVFLTYRSVGAINQVVEQAKQVDPLYDFTSPDGVQHTVWRVEENLTAQLTNAFQPVPAVYIADGHHRAASASRARAQLRDGNPNHRGDEEYNFFLGVAFPSDQVRILPYNRIVKDLNGMSPDEFLQALSRTVKVGERALPEPARKGEISMFLAGHWYALRLPEPVQSGDAISSLDVTLLQEGVLEPLLGIKDVRTDKRIDFVGGIRGPAELEKLVKQGAAAVAFSMYPVSVDELIAISDSNRIMPPKSTWFEPKLRDGLLIHVI